MLRRTLALLALIIGILAIGLGVAIGTITHHVSYKHVENARILHYLFIPNDQYGSASIQLANSPTLYTLPLNNFTPRIDGEQVIRAGYVDASFFYDAGATIHIDTVANTGTHLVGDAYLIVSITFSNAAGDQRAFSSNEYRQHPHGYDYNTWPPGFITIGVGILLTIIGVLLFRRKKQTPLSYSSGAPPQTV